MAKRYRARVEAPNEVYDDGKVERGGLKATHDRALKDGIDMAVRMGVIVVEEVEVEQKVTREWVEKK